MRVPLRQCGRVQRLQLIGPPKTPYPYSHYEFSSHPGTPCKPHRHDAGAGCPWPRQERATRLAHHMHCRTRRTRLLRCAPLQRCSWRPPATPGRGSRRCCCCCRCRHGPRQAARHVAAQLTAPGCPPRCYCCAASQCGPPGNPCGATRRRAAAAPRCPCVRGSQTPARCSAPDRRVGWCEQQRQTQRAVRIARCSAEPGHRTQPEKHKAAAAAGFTHVCVVHKAGGHQVWRHKLIQVVKQPAGPAAAAPRHRDRLGAAARDLQRRKAAAAAVAAVCCCRACACWDAAGGARGHGAAGRQRAGGRSSCGARRACGVVAGPVACAARRGSLCWGRCRPERGKTVANACAPGWWCCRSMPAALAGAACARPRAARQDVRTWSRRWSRGWRGGRAAPAAPRSSHHRRT